MKVCGKKTPLVHHRRRRRRKTLHHDNNAELENNNPHDAPDAVHVHPTAVKSDIAKKRSKTREDSKKKESRERSKSEKRKTSEPVSPASYNEAQKLATKLTNRLMSVLPPDTQHDKYHRVDSDPSSSDKEKHEVKERSSRTKSRENKQRRDQRKSVSPEKKIQSNSSTRQRSKSEIVHRNNVAEEVIEDKKSSNNTNNNKEVTIAKLGPFKMSLEVKNEKQQEQEKTKERKSRSSKVKEDGKSSTGDKDTRKRRSRSKVENKIKEKELKKSESKQPVAEEKVKTSSDKVDFDAIKTESEYLREEHQNTADTVNTAESGKVRKKTKDKIVVSKLTKSDRPVREKSPHKPVTRTETFKKVDTSAETGAVKKFNRSISQPGPPPQLDTLAQSPDNKTSLKRNLSLIINEKERQPRLKRSSTAKEESFVNVGNQKHSRSKIVENLTEKENQESLSFYSRDNLGFDSTSDRLDNEKRQQTILDLKDQIQSQFALSGSVAVTSETRNRKLNNFFSVESDESEDNARNSPPTQIQSLSEESSGSSTRRKKNSVSGLKFDSSEEESETGEGALVSLGLVHNSLPRDLPRNSSQAQLLQTDSESSSSDDLQTVPVYASNLHVKIPQGVPIPVPRTSLAKHTTHEAANKADLEKVGGDNGCDSDSTIDIRISNRAEAAARKKSVKKDSSWSVKHEVDDDDWEVGESSDDDLGDNTSVATDSIAQQMMY